MAQLHRKEKKGSPGRINDTWKVMAQGYNAVEAKTFLSSQQCLLWTVEHTEKEEVTFKASQIVKRI